MSPLRTPNAEARYPWILRAYYGQSEPTVTPVGRIFWFGRGLWFRPAWTEQSLSMDLRRLWRRLRRGWAGVRHHRRIQAGSPLNALSDFLRPPLST